MGCDIHFFTEIKSNGEWLMNTHLSIQRNYMLFAKMAGVRNAHDWVEPISKPKGLPGDISKTVQFYYSIDECGYHSMSWLSSKEVVALMDFIKNDDHFLRFIHGENPGDTIRQFGDLFGCEWKHFYEHREWLPDLLEDFRFVFWFDN